jgi:hypothetical protein
MYQRHLRTISITTLSFIVGFWSITTTAASHINKTVEVFHGPDTRECAFFRLIGVSEADPATPGVPWFAVPKTHPGYREIVAILLQARATGAPLQHVATTGAVVCGHAEVSSLSL